jgi:hypothetical protein
VPEPDDVETTVERIEGIIEALGESDPAVRELAQEAVRLLLQLYGVGLAHVIEIVGSDEANALAKDRLVSSLLLLHGVHPVPVEARVQEALRRVERSLDGAHLTVRDVTGDAARIHVNLNGGSAPAAAVHAMIDRAISEEAPDIREVLIEGLPGEAVRLVQIEPAESH